MALEVGIIKSKEALSGLQEVDSIDYGNAMGNPDVDEDITNSYHATLSTRNQVNSSPAQKYASFIENDVRDETLNAAQDDEEIELSPWLMPTSSGVDFSASQSDPINNTAALVGNIDPPAQVQPTQGVVEKSLFQKSWDVLPREAQMIAWPFISPFVKGANEENPIARGLVEGTQNATQGIVDLGRDITNALGGDFNEEEWLQIPRILESNPDSTTEAIVGGLTQFMSVFGMAGGIGKGATLAKQVAAGAFADSTFDPTGGNLATLLRELDIDNSLTQFLDSRVGEDADALERLEARSLQVLEGAGIGFTIPALIGAIKWSKNKGAPWIKEFLQDSDPNLIPDAMNSFGMPNPQKQIFAGEMAKFPPSGIDEARKITENATGFNYAGQEAKAWKKTGWHKLSDGKMAFEIDDSAARIKDIEGHNDWIIQRSKIIKPEIGEVMTASNLSDLIEHEELFRQYPELKELRVEIRNGIDIGGGITVGEGGTRASFNPIDFYVSVHVDPKKGFTKETLSSLLHEIQHSVQELEGWMNGGNTSPNFMYRLKTALSDDILPHVKDKKTYNFYASARNYADMLDRSKYWDEFSKRDSVTGAAKQIYNQTDWYKHRREITDLFGVPPKRYKKAEHNEFLKNVAGFYRDKLKENIYNIKQGAKLLPEDTASKAISHVDNMKQKNKPTAIQRQLDKAFDGNWKYNELKAIIKQIERANSPSERRDIYKRIQGEVQARNTQKRIDMPAKERAETPPYRTEDVERSDVIKLKNPSGFY